MNENLLAPIGYTFSAMALIAVVLMAVDVIRRDDFPGLQHGRGAVAGGVMRWVWLVLIVLSLGMGAGPILTGYAESSGLPGLQVTVGEPITYQAPAALTEWPDYSGTSITLPFYRSSSWSGETHDGQPFEASTEAIVLPVGILLVALAYWFFVARPGRSSPAVEFEVNEER